MFKQTSELMFFAICSWVHGRVILSEEEEKGMVSQGCKKTLVVSRAHDTNRNRNVISLWHYRSSGQHFGSHFVASGLVGPKQYTLNGSTCLQSMRFSGLNLLFVQSGGLK
jgi:hypothetical protein